MGRKTKVVKKAHHTNVRSRIARQIWKKRQEKLMNASESTEIVPDIVQATISREESVVSVSKNFFDGDTSSEALQPMPNINATTTSQQSPGVILVSSPGYQLESEFSSSKDFFEGKALPQGNFIVDLDYFTNGIRKVEAHTRTCSFNGEMVLKSSCSRGLNLTLFYTCSARLCGESINVSNEPNNNLNKTAVLGALVTGSGFSNEEEKFACMNTKYMCSDSYHKYDILVGAKVEEIAKGSMEAAINEEKRLAQERNDLDKDSYACISVTVDGGWCKRSYGHGYNASSGNAVIIGNVTKKIIYLGIRNKVCMICSAIASRRQEKKNHACPKNWMGPSTGMESSIIVEGMKYLEDVHKVRCTRVISDGDSNTMNKVRQDLKYGNLVKKIECANHACRRYRRALEEIQKNAKKYSGVDGRHARKALLNNIRRLTTAARAAIIQNAVAINATPSQESIDKLSQHFLNGPHHVFGKHTNCGDFCDKGGLETIARHDVIVSCGMMDAIQAEVKRVLVSDARMLVFNLTNNAAEQFMSLFCKAIGGKRVDHAKAGGIGRRAHAAALAYHQPEAGSYFATLAVLKGRSPGLCYRRMTLQRLRKQKQNVRRRLIMSEAGTARKRSKGYVPEGGDCNYGSRARKEDMDEETYRDAAAHYMEKLKVIHYDDLEEVTRGQSKTQRWMDERRMQISSSWFKEVASRKPTTCSVSLVRRRLCSAGIQTLAMKYGIDNKKTAIREYEKMKNCTVKECGLFVYPEHPFLSTSPDGLVGVDGLVEVKCPYLARDSESLEVVARSHKIGLKYEEDGTPFVPNNHKYYYQVQGQLAIMRREWCDVIFWAPQDIVIVRMARNDEFLPAIINRLTVFYKECLLPELVDSRFARGMPLREHPDILMGIVPQKKKGISRAVQQRTRCHTAVSYISSSTPGTSTATDIITTSTSTRSGRLVVRRKIMDL